MINKEELKRLNEIKNILIKAKLTEGVTPLKIKSLIEELGPTFIKIGQILSSRVDIIPKEYCDVLVNLRTNAPKMKDSELKSILNEEYKDVSKVFKSIGKCIGSASIAQVNEATLLNGDKIVIKVRRKNVYETMQMDVKLLKKAIKVLQLDKVIKIIDISKSLDEIMQVAYEECFFNIEREHLIKFKKLNENIEYIYSPKVYSNISTDSVLVMEYISGTYINEVDKLKEDGCDLIDLSYKLSDNYIKQALDDGFFHADPHAGNILVKDGVIEYLDLGMMGTLQEKNKKLLKEAIFKIVEDDYYTVAKILVDMSTQNGDVDLYSLKNNIRSILTNFSNSTLDTLDSAKFISDMYKMLRNHNLTLDKDVTMLIRGMCVIESVLKDLNPNLSLFDVLYNHIVNNKESLIDADKILNAAKSTLSSAKSMINIPKEINTFVKSLNDGDTKFKFELSDSTNQIDKIEKLLHELIIGIIDASLILASSLVTDEVIKKIFIVFIIILSAWLFIKMIFDHFHKGY